MNVCEQVLSKVNNDDNDDLLTDKDVKHKHENKEPFVERKYPTRERRPPAHLANYETRFDHGNDDD